MSSASNFLICLHVAVDLVKPNHFMGLRVAVFTVKDTM